MIRFATVAIALLACTCGHAEDYLLRIETIGFRDRPENEKQSAETTLETIEIIARANQPFYGRSSFGSAKLSITGVLEQLKDGRFRTQIRFRSAVDSGQSILGPNGLEIPITKSTNFETSAIVELQHPVELGKADAHNQSHEGKSVKTQTRTILSLVKYEPPSN